MITFNSFIKEVWENDLKKTDKKWLGQAGRKADAPEYELGQHKGKIKGHDIYHYHDANANRHHIYVHDPKTETVTSHIHGVINKAHSLSDVYATSTGKGPKMHEIYHHLLKHKHVNTIVGDNQSEGAKKVWKNLAKKKDISIHGWSNGKPINVTPYDEDEVYAKKSDKSPEGKSAGATKLVASYKGSSKK